MPKPIPLKPSFVCLVLSCLCLVALLATILLSAEAYGLLLLIPALYLAIQCWRLNRQFVWVAPPAESLPQGRPSGWRLGCRDGSVVNAHLADALIYPLEFTVIRFEGVLGRHSLFLWPDSASKPHLRRLRFLCSSYLPPKA